MAIRSGAGTGVIVSLVVFVLATVFLLVLCIVFYAGNREQVELVKQSELDLHIYARSNERSSDTLQDYVSLAKNANQSVTSYLNGQLQERNRIISGNPNASAEEIRSEFGNILSGSTPLAIIVRQLQGQLKTRQQEVDSRVSELSDAHAEIDSLEDQLDQQKQFLNDKVQAVMTQWQDVQDESIELNTKANDFFAGRDDRDIRLRGDYKGRILQLETEVDELQIERARLESTVDELRDKIDLGRMSAVNPALLVDGTVLEVSTGDEVFIDRGSNDRIVLGMTFEVYDSASQLRADQDGNFPRGKASIEVVKIGPMVSLKIKSSTGVAGLLRTMMCFLEI